MRELIKQIRIHMGMSQAELAERLRVSFATVNRWENGHAVPNRLAQAQIYELCEAAEVPVYDMILQSIHDAADSIPAKQDRTILYHGSKSGITGRIEPRSRRQCDFGKGFYMGSDPVQALTLVCDYEEAGFHIVSLATKRLRTLEVPANIDWAMLVAFHRGKMEGILGTPLYNKYRDMAAGKDLVIGSIADDRMFYVIDQFFSGNITDAALVHSLSALQIGRQYVAISQKACDAVRIERELPLSYLERQFIQMTAASNRAQGVILADKVCRDYRREGLYYDEILEQAAAGGQ